MVFPGEKTTPVVGIYDENVFSVIIHVLVKQNLKDWKIIDIVLFLFNVEIVFIKKKNYVSCNCGHHSLTKLCSPNAAFYNFSQLFLFDYKYFNRRLHVQRIIIRETRKKNCFKLGTFKLRTS